MNIISQPRLWVLLCSLLGLVAAQAAVPASTYVGQGKPGDPTANITVSVNVPSDSSDSLFFKFMAPASQSWAAFGFGNQMSGALIFVTYASADGKNVTLSPRLGTGHVMPQYSSNVHVNVLAGSGIMDGVFVVNAECGNCRAWSGGSLNVDSTSQPMIWAVGPDEDGQTLQSNDQSATINQHIFTNSFGLSLKAATGVGGVPVLSASNSNNTNTVNIGPGPGAGPGGPPNFRAGVGFHAFLMVAAFLVIFPLGYVLLRVFEKLWLHWGAQSFGLVLVLLGTGSGVGISKRQHISPSLNAPHQIFGFVIAALVLVTWLVGFIGHRIYKKTGTPAKVMIGHRVLGPLAVLLGLINAVVGFRFAGNTTGWIVFVIAAVLMVLTLAAITFFKRRQTMRKVPMNTPAAANFREGQMESGAPPNVPMYGQTGIPLQNYGPQSPPPMYR